MSSFKLLEVTKAIEDAIENMVDPETGELLTEEETLKICEALEGEKLEKVEWLSKMCINLGAEIDALTNHKRDIDKRLKSAKGKQERLKNFIGIVLEGEKYKSADGEVSISYRRNTNTTKVDFIDAIPDEYFKTPHTETNLNKTAIKEAILNGAIVPGVHLEDTVSVIIK